MLVLSGSGNISATSGSDTCLATVGGGGAIENDFPRLSLQYLPPLLDLRNEHLPVAVYQCPIVFDAGVLVAVTTSWCW